MTSLVFHSDSWFAKMFQVRKVETFEQAELNGLRKTICRLSAVFEAVVEFSNKISVSLGTLSQLCGQTGYNWVGTVGLTIAGQNSAGQCATACR